MATDSLIGRRWEVMRAALDERQRRILVAVEATGLVVSDADFAAIKIDRNEFHGEWNYCIRSE